MVNTALAVHFFTAPARDSLPYYSDELAYWNQIATFRTAGFDGGYVTVNETTAPLAWSRFGPHGPMFAIVYGSIARLTGWGPGSAVDLNVILVTTCAFVWLAATAPPSRPAILLLGTFWPLTLALTTTMQEPLQYALVLLLAALVVRMTRAPTVSRRVTVAFGLVIALASLLRPSWALLLVPTLADRVQGPLRRWAARAVGLAATAAVSAVFFLALAAPYPGSGSSGTRDLLQNPFATVASATARSAANLRRLLSPEDSAWLEIAFRYEALILLAVLVVFVTHRRAVDDASRRLLAIAGWFLGLTLTAVIAAGNIESWRDYRVLTPALFLTLLLAVNANWAPARVVFAAHFLLLPVAATTFAELYEPKFRADRTLVAKFADEAASVLTFQPGASGWTNTLLVPADRYEYPLLGIRPGIGVSSFFGWPDVGPSLKSRYVLLRPSERESAPPTVHLKKLRDTVHGTLYENVDPRMLESRP